MEKLKKAFELRFGKQDHESFINVVNAFFEEVRENSLLLVPMMEIKDIGLRPRLFPISNDSYALVLISDIIYMNHFESQDYIMQNAKDVISTMNNYDKIQGILINPFSSSHCFLPKKDILEVMKMNKF